MAGGKKDTKRDVLLRHLKYELVMLNHTFQQLQMKSLPQNEVNVLIESFCLHARNLIDFFSDSHKDKGREAAAWHFTKDTYRPPAKPKGLCEKINAQILHIRYDRTSAASEKIGTADRLALWTLVRNRVAYFLEELRPEYQSIWRESW